MSNPTAVLLVEVKPGKGQIVLPESEPISLADYNQEENITIPGHVVIQEGKTIRVGRDPSNELVLDIANISRFHMTLTATGNSLRVSDLSSTNGTFVNGQPVTATIKVSSGDNIEAGPAKLKVELLSDLSTETNLTMVGTQFDPISTTGLVTVLVADICNYTRMSEVLPTEDVTTTLQHWLHMSSEIITQHGGKVDKYIGDCVMAFWRCTDLNAKVLTVEAMKAAMEIKKQTRNLSESPRWSHKDSFDWDCRISLNTGQVMLGNIGGRGSREFTILGDVVNVPFRLNSVGGARGYQFILGGDTANHSADAFPILKLGPVAVKGRSQKVVAYTLQSD